MLSNIAIVILLIFKIIIVSIVLQVGKVLLDWNQDDARSGFDLKQIRSSTTSRSVGWPTSKWSTTWSTSSTRTTSLSSRDEASTFRPFYFRRLVWKTFSDESFQKLVCGTWTLGKNTFLSFTVLPINTYLMFEWKLIKYWELFFTAKDADTSRLIMCSK